MSSAPELTKILGPNPLPSPRTESVAGLFGRDNMFRPINARYAYGVLLAWNDQTNGPDHGDIFAKDDIREAIMIDLEGFPDDLVAPGAVFRLRPISPWGTCLREGFLKAGSEQARLQLKQMASELKVGVGEELKAGFDASLL